ncbi:hypothetical protein [Arthrobacter sp. zg-Y844]|uniref:hypothetical protein n=1 Tax=Arthrobacter sp. zg-Y844 TaxID=2964612 RepID=UPI002105A026|nr:hypothetical protein [Arthrobacter sp. zg-Y844]MCQ1988231.1 hypothetical protein [Arthrobacter sp. zg-Y844]
MDATLWKQIVDKAIRNTTSRDLLWSKSNMGPIGTRSFRASIDDNTTLNIWGYEKNYSYELHLTRSTAGEPFEERKRVTAKSTAEEIDFRGLFQAAQAQSMSIVRERAFDAVIDFLDNPTVLNPETEEVVFPENYLERSEHLNVMDFGWFTYSEDEKILARVRDLTAAGSIAWTFSEPDDDAEEFFSAFVGDSTEDGSCCLYLSFKVISSESKTARKAAYNFEMQHDPNFIVNVDIKPTNKQAHRAWILASDIHSIVSRQVRNDEEEFNKIVRDNIVHEILASLDDSHK